MVKFGNKWYSANSRDPKGSNHKKSYEPMAQTTLHENPWGLGMAKAHKKRSPETTRSRLASHRGPTPSTTI